MMPRPSLALTLALAAGWPAPAAAQVIYTVRDLGPLGGNAGGALGISATGQVVGRSQAADGSVRAFRTAPGGTLTDPASDLGPLGGTEGFAGAINSVGQVVGTAQFPPSAA